MCTQSQPGTKTSGHKIFEGQVRRVKDSKEFRFSDPSSDLAAILMAGTMTQFIPLMKILNRKKGCS
jgi:hypothetical protein